MHLSYFNKHSLNQSLKLTFISIIIFFAFIYMMLFLIINGVMQHFTTLQNTSLPLMEVANSATNNHLSAQNAMYKICLCEEKIRQKQYIMVLDSYDVKLQEDLQYILTHSESYKDNVTHIQNLLQEALTYRNQAILYCNQGAPTDALKLLDERYFPLMNQIQNELNDIYNTISTTNSTLLTRYKHRTLFFLCCSIICFIALFISAIYLIRKLITQIEIPLNEVSKVMAQMSKGELKFDSTYTATNEFGKLADEMRYMGKQLLVYISNISSVLTDLSLKHYDTTITTKYQGMFLPIQEALNTIITELNEVITSFSQTARHINQHAILIKNTATNLNTTTSSQSTAITQLATTIEHISSEVQYNATNTQFVSQKSAKLKEKLSTGNERIEELLNLTNRTTDSANEIQKIITLIEKIAKQTHLLALNASIEASKSGQNGKAFAVLAAEMGTLATDTQNSAKLTKDLIHTTLDSISQSSLAVSAVATTINEATLLAQNISDYTHEVAQTTTNQADAIEEYHLSIEELNHSIGHNTHIISELMTLGDQLDENAKLLNEKINAFHLKEAVD